MIGSVTAGHVSARRPATEFLSMSLFCVFYEARKSDGRFDRGDPWCEAQGLRRTVKWRTGVPGEKSAAQGKIILTATFFEWIWMLATGLPKPKACHVCLVADLSLSGGPGRVAGDRAVRVRDFVCTSRKCLNRIRFKLCSLQCVASCNRRMRSDGLGKRSCGQERN